MRVCAKSTDAAYRTAGASLDEGGEGREERREGRGGQRGKGEGGKRRETGSGSF